MIPVASLSTEGAVRIIEVLGTRAGNHGRGYVEPTEAAWELLEEALKPFERDLARRIELGLRDFPDQAASRVIDRVEAVQPELDFSSNLASEIEEWASMLPDVPDERRPKLQLHRGLTDLLGYL